MSGRLCDEPLLSVNQLSKAVVMYDSIAICKQVTVKKRKAYDMAPPAPMATGAEAEGSWA